MFCNKCGKYYQDFIIDDRYIETKIKPKYNRQKNLLKNYNINYKIMEYLNHFLKEIKKYYNKERAYITKYIDQLYNLYCDYNNIKFESLLLSKDQQEYCEKYNINKINKKENIKYKKYCLEKNIKFKKIINFNNIKFKIPDQILEDIKKYLSIKNDYFYLI